MLGGEALESLSLEQLENLRRKLKADIRGVTNRINEVRLAKLLSDMKTKLVLRPWWTALDESDQKTLLGWTSTLAVEELDPHVQEQREEAVFEGVRLEFKFEGGEFAIEQGASFHTETKEHLGSVNQVRLRVDEKMQDSVLIQWFQFVISELAFEWSAAMQASIASAVATHICASSEEGKSK